MSTYRKPLLGWAAGLATADPARPTVPRATRARSLRKSHHAVTSRLKSVVLLVAALAILWPSLAVAESVEARFNLDSPAAGPFPSGVFTKRDETELRGLRIDFRDPDQAPTAGREQLRCAVTATRSESSPLPKTHLLVRRGEVEQRVQADGRFFQPR